MNHIPKTPNELYNAFIDILQEIKQNHSVSLEGEIDVTSTPDYRDAVLWAEQNALRFRGENPGLPNVPSSKEPVDILNWCISAQKIMDEAILPKADNTCHHSADFRSVTWFGQKYTFNDRRAKIIKLFWESHPEPLNEKTIAAHINTSSSNYRLIDSFRSHGKYDPAWGTMIKSLGGGTYSLNKP
jgi:hypothetical protein